MRIAFAGTPEVAVPALEALAASGHEIVAVLTRPDAPLGRKRVLTPSPVAARAEELGLHVIRSAKPREDVVAELRSLEVELGVVVAYGALLRLPMLEAPAHGWINLHFSLLPKLRGAAPLQWAVLAGDAETGISIFRLEEGLDTGPVFAQRAVPIPPEATSGELLAELARDASDDLLAVVDAIAAGTAVARPQEGEPTHAPKLGPADGVVDWTLPAELVHARIRGATPEPGAASELDGQRLKLHAVRRLEAEERAPELAPGEVRMAAKRVYAGTGSEPIRLLRVQPAGKQAMDADAWWRGRGRETAVLS